MKKVFMWAYAIFMLFAPIVGLALALVTFKGDMDIIQWSILSILVVLGVIASGYMFTYIHQESIEDEPVKQDIIQDPVDEVMQMLYKTRNYN